MEACTKDNITVEDLIFIDDHISMNFKFLVERSKLYSELLSNIYAN